MRKREYRPMEEAPRDGEPIIAVCGGVECIVCWDDPGVVPAGWWHWDEEDIGPSHERIQDEPTGWRALFEVLS